MQAAYSDEVQNRYVRQFRDIAPLGAAADYHLRKEAEYYRLMEISRAIVRKDDIIGQGIRRLVANVLQQGPVLNPDTGSQELDAYLLDKWEAWSEDPEQCDASGQSDFLTMAYQVLEAGVVDGDIWALLTREGSVQIIEGHRVQSPRKTADNTFLGVVLGPMREQIAIHVAVEPIVPSYRQPAVGLTRIPVYGKSGARQVLQFVLHRRPNQTRGITTLAPILGTITQLGDLQFAQLVKAQSAAAFAIIHEYDPSVDVPGLAAVMGDSDSIGYSDGDVEEMELGPGMEYHGRPGESLTGFSPNIPNPEYKHHVKQVLTSISVNLDLPLSVLTLDPSETNFSGWRGALDQSQRAWGRMQRQLIRGWYTPIYEWKVRTATATDPVLKRFADDPGLLRHEFNPAYWPYTEPHKDAQGDALTIECRLNSRRKLLQRRGLNIDEVDSENVADQVRLFEKAILAASEINRQYPEANLDWREILSSPDPKRHAELPTPEAEAEVKKDEEDD